MSGSMLWDPGISLTLQQRVLEPLQLTMATEEKAKRSTAGSWKSFLGNLSARCYLESCGTIADFSYIDFLKFSESQRLTKDQCEAQWNEAIDRLMSSSHKGLQKKAISLKKQWKNKTHSDDADVFWSKVKRKRGLDKGTLEVQAVVDSLWNKRVREEFEREMSNIADEINEASASSGTNFLMPRQKTRMVERTNVPAAAWPLDHMLGQDSLHSSYVSGADPSDESRPSSDLLRTPLQSPTLSEPASPVRPFVLPLEDKDEDEEPVLTTVANQHHRDDSDSVFTSATEHQHREYLLQILHDGKQLPRNCNRPDYTFNLPLGGKDWGPQMTRIYDATRQKAALTFRDLNEIAVLSGVLHVDEEHAHLSKVEILQIRRDVLQTFYTNAQQEEDLKRAQAARDHWVTWCELWSSTELSASLAADQGAESTLDTTPVIDSIMAAYGDCKAKNILPVLFMALHVFRKFNTWSKLRSEADCAMAMVGPILEEVLQIQHEVKFTR
ncbi:hypothetical protein KI688_006615 [Linnemannia hyalina]|uniref:Uncharacterized protein n=1 Tax=Linnemannia hyalina TaxID=64524 RepID=A0A9P7XKQ6_9FUNG|nr:hypothetical protein KI688_006615 [Linnemannia hyalina]